MSKSKITLALLGGAIAGLAIGIFFATDKGSEIRKTITKKAKNLADSILAKAEEIVNEAEEASNNDDQKK